MGRNSSAKNTELTKFSEHGNYITDSAFQFNGQKGTGKNKGEKGEMINMRCGGRKG
jgi:hypothetical protein